MSWLDELDLDPEADPVSMGVRALGDRPWLVADERRHDELALKASLCRSRHAEVFAAEPQAWQAGLRTAELVQEAGFDLVADTELNPLDPADQVTDTELNPLDPADQVSDAELHPLDRAGRSVQEDLCLMERRSTGWHLAAASLCFPSRWRLAAKMGRHVTDVHGPVTGYDRRLAARVDTFFDRLGPAPAWRRNWFVHPDDALFQPDRPPGGDPVIAADRALTTLVVRSERQTLRLLAPLDGWILFTIRVQQATLATLVADPDRAERFRHLLATGPSEVLAHRGLGPAQVTEIQAALR